MKTRFILLVLLIVCISCGTNNKPVSDAQKEKIKEEVKEVLNNIFKGAEEANADMIIGSYLDSPDFVFTYNENSFSYKQFADMAKSLYGTFKNQKGTIVDEKYVVIDNSTVLYTANTKWLMNYKDGHAILHDPCTMQYIFKKVDSKWKIISGNESGVEKNVPNETSKELNQVELMKQNIGYWKCDIAKGTTGFYVTKPYGTGLDCDYKFVTKGKTVKEGKDLWGYDKRIDKYLWATVTKGSDIEVRVFWFITNTKYEVILYSDISNPEKASWKIKGEFKSPALIVETTIVNNKTVKTDTWTRVK